MPAITATAPGKIILFGEHAVVYGRPAIAVPVMQVKARAILMPNPRGEPGQVHIQAPDVGLDADVSQMPPDDPLAAAVSGVLSELGVSHSPACTLRITSTIPVASGLGSGAAVSVALIRAFAAFLGRPLPPERVSALAYEVEKIHHGTPSGIDNTVVTYAQPVYFVRGAPIQILELPRPFTIVIGDTGVASPTAIAVADVRRAWEADPEGYQTLFNAVAKIVQASRGAIEAGTPNELGLLMDKNHDLLCKMGVSSPELDHLVESARQAGALGAKLSGGGRGGNMIALVEENQAPQIAQSLLDQSAKSVITTTVGAPLE